MAALMNEKNFITAVLNDKVKIAPRMINKNIDHHILNILKSKVENKCSKHGYIKKNTIEIEKKNIGVVEMQSLHGYVVYNVLFKASVCNPVIGNNLECIVKNVNNFGILCVSRINDEDTIIDVLDVIIPKHSSSINSDVDLNDIKIGMNVLIQIVGKKYQLNNPTILIVGKILSFDDFSNKNLKLDNDNDDNQLDEIYSTNINDDIIDDEITDDDDEDDDESNIDDDKSHNNEEDFDQEGGIQKNSQFDTNDFDDDNISDIVDSDIADDDIISDDEF